MEAQRKLVHVDEGAVGKLAHGVLPDLCKQRVPQLVEGQLRHTHEIVGNDQHHRRDQEGGNIVRCRKLAPKRVGRPFEEIRHQHEHQLGDHEKHRRPNDAHLQVQPIGRPHIGPEIEEGPQHRAFGNGLLSHGEFLTTPLPAPFRAECRSFRDRTSY